ncbi:MAG: CvpA family protein [Hyphomonadaceae bacterium]|nr:CvpA family protein [Clostridia bacterium]
MQTAFIWDIIAVAVLALCVFGGIQKGFVKLISRLLSFILAIVLTLTIRPVIVDVLKQNGMYQWMEKSIAGWFTGNQGAIMASGLMPTPMPIQNNLPAFMTDVIGQQVKATTDAAFGQMAGFAVDIVLFAALFFIIKYLLLFATAILDKLASLPLINGVNKLAGGVMGVINGCLMLYMACAILMFVSGTPPFQAWVQTLHQSSIMTMFYDNNLLLQLFMTKKA